MTCDEFHALDQSFVGPAGRGWGASTRGERAAYFGHVRRCPACLQRVTARGMAHLPAAGPDMIRDIMARCADQARADWRDPEFARTVDPPEAGP